MGWPGNAPYPKGRGVLCLTVSLSPTQPIDRRIKTQVVLSDATLAVRPRFLYMGAGHVDCKLGCTLYEFVRALDPIVASVSDPRDGDFLAED